MGRACRRIDQHAIRGGFVVLICRRQPASGEWRDEEYRMRIVRTACNIGGSRPWFVCPAAGGAWRSCMAAGSSRAGTATS